MKKIEYFNVEKLLLDYPDAWCFICIGGRKIGKTYSSLKMMLQNKSKFVFVKRTIEDVKLLCAGNGVFGSKPKFDENGKRISADLSPFVPINRDFGTNVQAWSIMPGLGGFWHADASGDPAGPMIGYVAALAGVTKFKGFDMSEADYMIFDEFVPQPWERVSRREGEQVLDLYTTIGRDRIQRGRGPLKLLALANATEINSPLTQVLEVTDTLAEMAMNNEETRYIADRGIVLALLKTPESFMKSEEESPIYKALASTAWGRIAFGNSFAYNDMTSVQKLKMRGFRPYFIVIYKKAMWFAYQHPDGHVYVTYSAFSAKTPVFDLAKENDQKRFFRDIYYDLRQIVTDDLAGFETYTMYDVLVNFKKHFNV